MGSSKILYYFCPTAKRHEPIKDFPSIHDRIHTGYSNAYTPFYEMGKPVRQEGGKEVIAGPCERSTGWRNLYEGAPTDTMRHLFGGWKAKRKAFLFYAGQRMLE